MCMIHIEHSHWECIEVQQNKKNLRTISYLFNNSCEWKKKYWKHCMLDFSFFFCNITASLVTRGECSDRLEYLKSITNPSTFWKENTIRNSSLLLTDDCFTSTYTAEIQPASHHPGHTQVNIQNLLTTTNMPWSLHSWSDRYATCQPDGITVLSTWQPHCGAISQIWHTYNHTQHTHTQTRVC